MVKIKASRDRPEEEIKISGFTWYTKIYKAWQSRSSGEEHRRLLFCPFYVREKSTHCIQYLGRRSREGFKKLIIVIFKQSSSLPD